MLSKFWKGKCKFAHNNSSSHTGGIALMFGDSLSPKVLSKDENGRFLFVEISYQT